MGRWAVRHLVFLLTAQPPIGLTAGRGAAAPPQVGVPMAGELLRVRVDLAAHKIELLPSGIEQKFCLHMVLFPIGRGAAVAPPDDNGVAAPRAPADEADGIVVGPLRLSRPPFGQSSDRAHLCR